MRRSGGFAGITDEWSLDTSASDDRARTAEQLARQLVALGDRTQQGFDIERYEVCIADGARQETVTLDSDAAAGDSPLGRLLALLPRRP